MKVVGKISWLPKNYIFSQSEFNRTTVDNKFYHIENADTFNFEEMFKHFEREKCLLRKVEI